MIVQKFNSYIAGRRVEKDDEQGFVTVWQASEVHLLGEFPCQEGGTNPAARWDVLGQHCLTDKATKQDD